MNHRLYLIAIVVALLSVPAVAASQPQVPTPTGFLGGRESADETVTVEVVPTRAMTPPASPAANDIPGAAECDVASRERDFTKLTDPPAASIVGPEETRRVTPARTLAALPSGQPADNATLQAVTATVRRLVACANSRDSSAYEALHTDDYFRRAATVIVEREESQGVLDWIFGVSETTSVSYGFVGFPPDSLMPTISDVSVLPDGRVGAVVSGPDMFPIFFAFDREQGDGPFLIDEAIQIIAANGTPAA